MKENQRIAPPTSVNSKGIVEESVCCSEVIPRQSWFKGI